MMWLNVVDLWLPSTLGARAQRNITETETEWENEEVNKTTRGYDMWHSGRIWLLDSWTHNWPRCQNLAWDWRCHCSVAEQEGVCSGAAPVWQSYWLSVNSWIGWAIVLRCLPSSEFPVIQGITQHSCSFTWSWLNIYIKRYTLKKCNLKKAYEEERAWLKVGKEDGYAIRTCIYSHIYNCPGINFIKI